MPMDIETIHPIGTIHPMESYSMLVGYGDI